jgi:hypothetical protein
MGTGKEEERRMKIESLWAYISEDEKGEGLCGFQDPNTGQWMPMICADEARLKALRPFAHQIAVVTKKKIKVVKFTQREDIDAIDQNTKPKLS